MTLRSILLAAMASLTLLGGCSGDRNDAAGAARPLVVGFSQIGAESEWRTANSASVKQAIEAAGRQNEGIVITGIDANPQAREEIAKGGNFEASVAQDFTGIGTATADAVAEILDGKTIKQHVIYVPTKLITAANAKE